MLSNRKILIGLGAVILIIAVAVVLIFSGGGTIRDFRSNPAESSDLLFPSADSRNIDGMVSSLANADSFPEGDDLIISPIGANIRRIGKNPVAAAHLSTLYNSTSTVLTLVEQGTGHIFMVNPEKDTPPSRISNQTVPRVQEVIWGQDKTTLKTILRVARGNIVESTLVAITEGLSTTATTSVESVSATQLKEAILQASSPDGSKIFSLSRTSTGVEGRISDFEGKTTKILFTSPVNEWLASWETASMITLQTKPAANVLSHLYSLNTTTGQLTKLMSGSGLTAKISPDGKRILSSESSKGAIITSVLEHATGVSRRLPINTLTDKCIWSDDSLMIYCAVPEKLLNAPYPDSWYQSEVMMNDNIWKVSSLTGRSELIFSPSKSFGKYSVDAIDLTISPNEKFLAFINKYDSSLWLLTLKD